MESRPRIAICMGDPTGVGPEIIVAALQSQEVHHYCRPLVVGRSEILRDAQKLLGLPDRVMNWTGEFDAIDVDTIACLDATGADSLKAVRGQIDPRGGQAAYDCLLMGAELVRRGAADALVTAPLHKAALQAAGHHWPGHTELLAHLCGVSEFAMMLYLPPCPALAPMPVDRNVRRGGPVGMGVIHVTLHAALRDVFDRITVQSVLEKTRLADHVFRRIRAAQNLPSAPALAVAALNPHAGESGLFGKEESEIIAPAVRAAVDEGIQVVGPLAVDTLFPRLLRGDFDAVVAMYHDQGHIAFKLLDMFDAVNITLGLPIVRTSVAHGTAHDIAWKGCARQTGMIQAILTAARLTSLAR